MDLLTFIRNQRDRVAAWCCVALGAVVLIFGWVGVSGTPFPAEQIPYIVSGGLGGLFLLGFSAVLWLSADLRDEWRKLDAIEELMQKGADADSLRPASRARSNGRAPDSVRTEEPAG